MKNKGYTPKITVRWRSIDAWYGAECPDCGASIIDTTSKKVKSGMKKHGDKFHNWNRIKFDEQV